MRRQHLLLLRSEWWFSTCCFGVRVGRPVFVTPHDYFEASRESAMRESDDGCLVNFLFFYFVLCPFGRRLFEGRPVPL